MPEITDETHDSIDQHLEMQAAQAMPPPEVLEEPVAPVLEAPVIARKCKLEDWFHVNFVALMQATPENKLVRGHMMRILGVMPPAELKTFEQLKDWVETTMENPARKPAVPERRSIPEFEVDFRHTRTASGSCNYSMDEEGYGTAKVPLSDIQDWIEDGKTVEEIAELIEQAESDDGVDFDTIGGSESYSDHGNNDWSNENIHRSENTASFERRLREYLATHDPGLLEQLDNN
jgi:hypothetical protein